MFFVVIIRIAAGQIMWVLKETPAVFGTDIQLLCSLPNDISCCRKYNRKWNVGWKYTLTIMNDKSLNETKYSEELDAISHTSILTIKSFSVADVNIPYECVYGFKKFRAILKLTTEGYEFHPKEKLPVKPTVIRNNILLNVTFQLVYPVPVCSAMIGVNNISSELNVSSTSHHLLYMSTVILNYTTSPTECQNVLNVTCLVGKTVLIVTNSIPCSSDDDPLLLIITTGTAGIVVFGLLTCLVLVVFHKRRKHNAFNKNTEEGEQLTKRKRRSFNMTTLKSKDKA